MGEDQSAQQLIDHFNVPEWLAPKECFLMFVGLLNDHSRSCVVYSSDICRRGQIFHNLAPSIVGSDLIRGCWKPSVMLLSASSAPVII